MIITDPSAEAPREIKKLVQPPDIRTFNIKDAIITRSAKVAFLIISVVL